MFLRHKICRKDGKEHRTFSIVENRRLPGGRVVQRHALCLCAQVGRGVRTRRRRAKRHGLRDQSARTPEGSDRIFAS